VYEFGKSWWHRLLKVLYVIAYLPLIGLVIGVWLSNTPYCTTYQYSSNYCRGSYGEAFWYSVLSLAIYIVILRLIKIAILFIAIGRKPLWKEQLKSFF
jgi:hypothetical protein